MTKLIYEATKCPDTEPLLWTVEQEEAFSNIKQALTWALILGPYSGPLLKTSRSSGLSVKTIYM